jgi:hypothetical protein
MEDNEILRNILRDLDNPEPKDIAMQELMGESQGFDPEFADRVTEAAFSAPTPGLADYLPRMFRWVAIVGAAAAIALLVLTWYQSQSLDADAMAGITDLSIGDEFAENLF